MIIIFMLLSGFLPLLLILFLRFGSDLFLPRLPLAPKTDPERQGDQTEIQSKRLFADVVKIVTELATGGRIFGKIDGGQAGEAGACSKAVKKPRDILVINAVPLFIVDGLPDSQCPRADETHFTAQNIDDLRQFVQTGRTQDAPYLGNTMIILLSLLQAEFFICVGNHRTELEDSDYLAEASPPFLVIKDRSTIFELDGNSRED